MERLDMIARIEMKPDQWFPQQVIVEVRMPTILMNNKLQMETNTQVEKYPYLFNYWFDRLT